MLVPTKSFLASRTTWLAIAVAVLALLEAVLGLLTTIGISTEWLLGALAALIAFLRAVTSQPVGLKAGVFKELKLP